MDRIEVNTQGQPTSYVGASAVEVFRAKAIIGGLRFYAKTGMRINAAYTPKNMLAAVEQMTGRKFKRSQLNEAAEALAAKFAPIEQQLIKGA